MKWFHHECAAKHDPKLQTLSDEFGAEGLGIYWGLLEEIGQHSETFHLKVSGISREADTNFDSLMQTSEKLTLKDFSSSLDVQKIPQLSIRLLAKNLFTSTQKLTKVLQTLTKIGLFESPKWLKYNVLYSPSFEQRADDYTRRQQRKSDNVRTNAEQDTKPVRTDSEQCSENVQSESAKVRLETEQKQKRKEEEQNSIQACTPIEQTFSTGFPHTYIRTDEEILIPNESQFHESLAPARSSFSPGMLRTKTNSHGIRTRQSCKNSSAAEAVTTN